ncbi:MAG: PIN domain-containing protein [Acidobacteria bacterium]|nr:PIN domain-containing protein [Acidobacteriota bacterium]
MKTRAYLREVRGQRRISVITRAEVLAGVDAQSVAPVRHLLDSFLTLGIDARVADLAATLRREHGWKLPDALQAAIAQTHRLKLATRNSRDFPPRQFGFVVVPYSR